ncbi:MAG: hypothetical protein AAGL90_07740 [Pseudomonadota bacterium]
MLNLQDLSIPLSALTFSGPGAASAMAADWDARHIGVLLQAVIQSSAQSAIEAGSLHTVSVTFDVSAEPKTGSEIQFESRIDRKTRTLIFASGLAYQASGPVLKATLVYRIA